MRHRICPSAVALIALIGAARGASPVAAPSVNLAGIQSRLRSDDFAIRQAAQADLDAIPPDQITAVREAAATATDSEVKARLAARVDAMELYTWLHPPLLSIDVKDGTPADVATALSRQMGAELVSAGNSPIPGNRYTLQAANQPLWEILRQLNEQSPLNFDQIGSNPNNPPLKLEYQDKSQPSNLKIMGAFALRIVFMGTPGSSAWRMRITGYADPRLNVLDVSAFQVDSMKDQGGSSLLPLLVAVDPGAHPTLSSPHVPWSDQLRLNPAPGLKSLGTFKVTYAVTLFTGISSKKVDLQKSMTKSVDTPHGRVVLEEAADGKITLKLPLSDGKSTPVPDLRPIPYFNTFAGPAVSGVMVRLPSMLNSNGAVVHPPMSFGLTPGDERTLDRGPEVQNAEVYWVERTRPMNLQFEYKNLDVPAIGLPILRGAAGG